MKLTKAQRELREVINKNHKITVAYGGSGSGKTTGFLYDIICKQINYGINVLAVRESLKTARASLFQDNIPTVLKQMGISVGNRKSDLYYMNKSDLIFFCKSHISPITGKIVEECKIYVSSLDQDNVGKFQGTNFGIFYGNEMANQPSPEPVEELMTRLRGGDISVKKRLYIDFNPGYKSHWTFDLTENHLLNGMKKDVGVVSMHPMSNIENLGQDYIDDISSLSPRLNKKFFTGEFQDPEDALFSSNIMIWGQKPFKMDVICIAIDPAITSDEKSNETGIIVCGMLNNKITILNDLSGKFSPEIWVAKVRREISERISFCGKVVVLGEVNQGGDLVSKLIYDMYKQSRLKFTYIPITSTIEKRRRFEDLSYSLSSLARRCQLIWDENNKNNLKTLESHLLGYPMVNYLDRIDALSMNIKYLKGR